MDDADTEDEMVHDPDDEYLEEPEEVEYVMDDWPMQVREGLYIGSCMAEMNKKCLLRVGITDILQVAQGLYPHHPLVFNYMNIQVQDIPSEDLVRFFPNCFEFIDRAINKGGAVLVHCAAGVSRSATVVLGYLMSRHKMDLAAAVEHLKAIRPWVQPNTGFLQQLEVYQDLSHDLSRWRAWPLVWKEQQQQQHEVQQQQQQWLQIPQAHSQQQHQQHGSNATNANSIQCNTSTPGPAAVAAAAAAAVHQCALPCSKCCSSNRGDCCSSSSLPVNGAPSLAAAACAATCAAAAAAGNVTVCNAAPKQVPEAAAAVVETGSSSIGISGKAECAHSRSQTGNNVSSSSGKKVAHGRDTSSPPWQQQQQHVESSHALQVLHVDAANERLTSALGPAPAAAAASAEQQMSDTKIADVADMYEI